MTLPSLAGVVERMDRAYQHLIEFDDLCGTYFDSGPYVPRLEHHAQTNRIFVVHRVTQPFPLRGSVVLGEAIQNARIALDYLAWQLVLLEGRTPSVIHPRTQFPVHSKLPKSSNGALRLPDVPPGLSHGLRNLLDAVQPYHRGNRADKHPLSVLNALANTDKHHVLNVTTGLLRSAQSFLVDPLGTRWGGDIRGGAVRHDEVIQVFQLPPGMGLPPNWREWGIEGKGEAFVAFEQPGPWSRVEAASVVVERCLDWVSNIVVAWFRPFFPPDGGPNS